MPQMGVLGQMLGRLAGRLVGRMVGRLVGRIFGRLAGRLFGRHLPLFWYVLMLSKFSIEYTNSWAIKLSFFWPFGRFVLMVNDSLNHSIISHRRRVLPCFDYLLQLASTFLLCQNETVVEVVEIVQKVHFLHLVHSWQSHSSVRPFKANSVVR